LTTRERNGNTYSLPKKKSSPRGKPLSHRIDRNSSLGFTTRIERRLEDSILWEGSFIHTSGSIRLHAAVWIAATPRGLDTVLRSKGVPQPSPSFINLVIGSVESQINHGAPLAGHTTPCRPIGNNGTNRQENESSTLLPVHGKKRLIGYCEYRQPHGACPGEFYKVTVFRWHSANNSRDRAGSILNNG